MYNWSIKKTLVFNIWIFKEYSNLNYLFYHIPIEIIIYIDQLVLGLYDIHESNMIPCYEKECMNHWLDLFNSFNEDELKTHLGFYHCKLKKYLTNDEYCHNIRLINDTTHYCDICDNNNCEMHQYGYYVDEFDDEIICCEDCIDSHNIEVDPYFK